MKLGLVDILKLGGFDPTHATKLVRHQDRRFPMQELRRDGSLEIYQSYQSKPKFHGAKQIISFYGLSGTRAGFYGVYKVLGCQSSDKGDALPPCDPRWSEGAKFFYQLERDPRFDGLRDRLIIDWGPGTLAWVQNLDNKTVVEIQEAGRRLPRFEDYLEVDQLLQLDVPSVPGIRIVPPAAPDPSLPVSTADIQVSGSLCEYQVSACHGA